MQSTEVWHIEEGINFECQGTWTKISGTRSEIEYFKVNQRTGSNPHLEADIQLIRTRDHFGAKKTNARDGNIYYYFGQINGDNVQGFYTTTHQTGEFPFRARIL